MWKSHYLQENKMEKFTLEEIKEKIYYEGLKSIKSFYTLFKFKSPINETTKETLSFEEWYKTIEVTFETGYLPKFITDNLGNIGIKELFNPYLKEQYNNYLREEEKND